MPSNLEITPANHRLHEESASPTEIALDVAPPVVDAPARVDETGVELKRGAFLNTIAMLAFRFFNNRLHVQPQMVSALALVLCAMPGLALYRISTAISRGMKVMQHDIFSRGMTEPIATTLAFLLALAVGFKEASPEVAAIVGTAASGLMALALASTLCRHIPAQTDVVSLLSEARSLLRYAAPISIYQLINAFIARLDLIMLGYFVGRAPGVTLATVGVYSAVIGTANGLRKVNQAFNPIFAPVVACMTATGDHDVAAATYARLAQWMLW